MIDAGKHNVVGVQVHAVDYDAAVVKIIGAARRSEPAPEAAPLEHGLLTYVLLRGMGEEDIKKVPEVRDIFEQAPTADLDADREVGVVHVDGQPQLLSDASAHLARDVDRAEREALVGAVGLDLEFRQRPAAAPARGL